MRLLKVKVDMIAVGDINYLTKYLSESCTKSIFLGIANLLGLLGLVLGVIFITFL